MLKTTTPPPPPLAPADRKAIGLAARKQLARSAHARSAKPKPSAPSAPLEILRASERGRIPELLKLKHQRMAASPFGFFRGAVPVMAADLAAHPNTGLNAQLCGDAHVSNLGAYEGQDGNLVFDINDFDESLPGPFEFDLKRMVTSIVLAGREAGIRRHSREDAVLHFAESYRKAMRSFSALPLLELARYQIHRLGHIDPMPAILSQAERSTPLKSLKSLTQPSPNQAGRVFRSRPPLLKRLEAEEERSVLAALIPYARTLQPERRHLLSLYTPIDVAFKVVGTGSVGLRDYCVYLEGSHCSKPDPLFLQIKEETASAYAAYLPSAADRWSHNGHRVMDGQRAMQLTSDPFLGYTTIEGRDYLVRQLNDHKAALDLTTLTAARLSGYADICGELFARGHARSGDPVAIQAYLGSSARMDEALLSFAHDYADTTEKYFESFKKALAAK